MRHGLGFVGLFVLLSAVLPSTAFASVKREGTWPSEEKKISLDVSGASKAEAVRRIATAAGWNVIVHAPPGDPIDIHVKDLPATKVLELVLGDANYVARREGNLIDIVRETSADAASPSLAAPPSPPEPPSPPSPPSPPGMGSPPAGSPPPGMAPGDAPRHAGKHRHGKTDDRIVSGGSLRIEKGETVDDISVFGGSVDVFGEVLGDLAVMGGKATIHDGAYVHGDVSAIGGKVRIDSGATVDGEVGVVGGSVDRAPGAKIGGNNGGSANDDSEPDEDTANDDGHKPWSDLGSGLTKNVTPGKEQDARPWYKKLAEHASNAVEHTALLFVLGAVLLSLATRRMDLLREEVAARPMRSFAVGILATIASAIALVALCVTVIGIPIAIVVVLMGAFGVYAGICAALATLGKGLVAHKTENQHVHLAVGCAVFLLLSALPFVGWLVVVVVGLIGFGALVATRLAGFAPKKGGAGTNTVPGDGPYRTPT